MRVAIAILLGLALLPGPAAAAERPCRPAGSRTLLATATTRVYEVPVRGEDYARVYGCRYSGGRPWRLGDNYDQGHDISDIAPIGVRGRYLAYSDFLEHYSDVNGGITVRDLRSGRRIHRFLRRNYVVSSGAVMDNHGSVAWIGKLANGSYDVRRSDRLGHNTRLDAGTGIDPESLRLTASIVSWRNGQAERTAPLR
jgi:hypothetical protein